MRETCEPWYTGAKCLAHNKRSTAGSGERLRRTAARRAGKGDTEKAPPKAPASASAFWIRRDEAAFSPIYIPRKAHGEHVQSLRPKSCKHPACSPGSCSNRSPPPDLASPGRWQRPLASGRARHDGGRSRSHAPAVTGPRAAARLHLLEVR